MSCKRALTVQKEEPVWLVSPPGDHQLLIHENRYFGIGELWWVKFVSLSGTGDLWCDLCLQKSQAWMPQQPFKTEKISSVDPACPGNLSVLLPWWAEMMEVFDVLVVSQVTNYCLSGLLDCVGFWWWCFGTFLGWFLLAGLHVSHFFCQQ